MSYVDKTFLYMTPKAQVTKEKSKLGFYQPYKLLCFKGYHQESSKKTHKKGENICKS